MILKIFQNCFLGGCKGNGNVLAEMYVIFEML